MTELADIFNAPSDEEEFLGFKLDIPIETLSLEDRHENVNLPGTSGMVGEKFVPNYAEFSSSK